MAELKKVTKVFVTKKPGPFALVVETTPFTITSSGGDWEGKADVTFADPTVNVILAIRGQKGQEYELKLVLNQVEKDIAGALEKDGVNTILKDYPLSDFNLAL